MSLFSKNCIHQSQEEKTEKLLLSSESLRVSLTHLKVSLGGHTKEKVEGLNNGLHEYD